MMNEQRVRDILSGQQRGIAPTLLRAGLLVASGLYAMLMRLRRWAYRRGLLPDKNAGVPVICVGNLTTGGTGKTPMVACMVRHLQKLGRKPAILTRGYRALDGKSDEAELLRQLTGAAVIVNADRTVGAAAAVADGADVLVMDDGFQHLRLKRDLNIVLIDATNPFGYGHVLPRGLLREPCSALRDAHAIVITHSDLVSPESLAALRGQLVRLAPQASLHAAAHRPTAVVDEKGQRCPPNILAGKKVAAFCGIGNPNEFFMTLERLGARLVARRAFADHAAIYPNDLNGLGEADTVLVTTQKDAVRLDVAAVDRAVWQLIIETDMTEGAVELAETVARFAQQDRIVD